MVLRVKLMAFVVEFKFLRQKNQPLSSIFMVTVYEAAAGTALSTLLPGAGKTGELDHREAVGILIMISI